MSERRDCLYKFCRPVFILLNDLRLTSLTGLFAMSPTESFWKASVYTVLVLLGLFVSINEKCASVLQIYQLSSGCQPAVCSSNSAA